MRRFASCICSAMRRRRPMTLISSTPVSARAARRAVRPPAPPRSDGVEVLVHDAARRAAAAHAGAGRCRARGAPAHGRRGDAAARPAAAARALGVAAAAARRSARRRARRRLRGRGAAAAAGRGRCRSRRPAALRRVSARPATSMPHQLGADRQHAADLAAQRERPCRRPARDLHRRLVGHHVGEHLVLRDHVADLDVPGDDLGLGDAFADVGQLDDARAHLRPPSRACEGTADALRARGNSPIPARADRACPSR